MEKKNRSIARIVNISDYELRLVSVSRVCIRTTANFDVVTRLYAHKYKCEYHSFDGKKQFSFDFVHQFSSEFPFSCVCANM